MKRLIFTAIVFVISVPLWAEEREKPAPSPYRVFELAQESEKTTPSPSPPPPRTMDVELIDAGKLRLTVEVEKIEVESPYGKLSIPVDDIVQIQFATRLTEAQTKRVEAAIFNLGSSDFGMREDAAKELLDLGEKAYPAVVKAIKHADLEVAHRAQELAGKMREIIPEERLVVREHDIVETIHSKISGRVGGKTIAVKTVQFGPQELQLSDVRNFRSMKAPVEDAEFAGKAEPDPGNLLGFHDKIGKTFAFKVTGRVGGSCYGTVVYTTDSSLATAAVHCGALKDGETGVVRVKMIASPPAFTSSAQNGITSSGWGPYPAAYEVLVKKK